MAADGDAEPGAEVERRQRIRAWLQSARCRLNPDDHAAFGQALRELQKARSVGVPAAEVFSEGVLRSVARLLWRADFPEGPQAHQAWAEAFEEGLPPEYRPRWRSCLVSDAAPLPGEEESPEERQLQRQLQEWLRLARAQGKSTGGTLDELSLGGKKPLQQADSSRCKKRPPSLGDSQATATAGPAAGVPSPLLTGGVRSRTLRKCKSPVCEIDRADVAGAAASAGAACSEGAAAAKTSVPSRTSSRGTAGGRRPAGGCAGAAGARLKALASAATPARASHARRASGAAHAEPAADEGPAEGDAGAPGAAASPTSRADARRSSAAVRRRRSSFAHRVLSSSPGTSAAGAEARGAEEARDEASLAVSSTAVQCSICCDEAPPQSAFSLGCSHGWYCGSCLLRHAEARLAAGSAEVPCPECFAPVPERDLRRFLPPATVERLLARSLEQAVSAAPDLRACPTPNCPMRVALDEGETGRLHCPMCKKVSCIRCGARPFHRGLTCEQYAARQKQKGNRGDEESLQKWMDSVGAKKCPSCSMAVTKQTLRNQATQYSECHKMLCRNCSTRFCFKCLAILTDTYTCGCSSDLHGFIDPVTGIRLEHLKKKRGAGGKGAAAKAAAAAKKRKRT